MYTYCACTVTHVRLQFPLEHPICNPLNEETRVCCHGIVASTKFSKLQLQNRRLFGWGGGAVITRVTWSDVRESAAGTAETERR
jgi:hypothetical protein